MKLLPAFVAALAALCPAQTSTDVSWGLFPFLVGNQDGDIPQIVGAAASRGVDTLYVSAFRAQSSQNGDLWITDHAGWNPAWGPVRPGGAGIDLKSLITAAHAQNIRVVAVLKCFADTVQPTDAAHRQYLLDVIDWLVHSYDSSGRPVYDLDGIALDYIRFVSAGSGNNPTLVTNLVGQIKSLVGMLSVDAYLLANRYSFDGPVYNSNFNSYTATMATLQSSYGQDWEGLAQHLDVMMPMCYTADGSIYNTYNGHRDYVRQAAVYARNATGRAGRPAVRVVPVIKTYSSTGETTTASTIDASIVGALQGNADGYQSFRYGTMRSVSSWMTAFHAHATPGPNWPIARLSSVVNGLTATLDPAASTDLDEPTSSLSYRLDLDGDGTPDTAWMLPSTTTALLPTAAGARFGLQVRDSTGQISATTRHVRGGMSLTVGSQFYSANNAFPLPIQVNAGPAGAGSTYLTLVSLSGSSPGFTWNGYNVPLNFDGLSNGMLESVNGPLLTNGLGTLDAQGRATAQFFIPSPFLAPFVFQNLTWAAIAIDGTTGAPNFVTNSANCLILN